MKKKKAAKKPRGVQRTAKITDALVEWISEGKTLRSFCREPGSPSFRSAYSWINADEELASRIARARLSGHDAIADQCLEIADDIEIEVPRAKNQIWTRLQLLAKWDPKRYGDRQAIDIESKGGLVRVSTGVPDPEPTE